MRLSQFPITTSKETPADAEIISHQLMLRAGLIRRLSSGLFTWMPLGLRVLQRVQTIVREEMERAGAVELLMPSIQPAELWEESGRWSKMGPQMLKMRDRHDRDFCYGPTHEEVICHHVRQDLKSYKQLPVNYFQIQTKFRDEIRPRFGVMRSREFLMKDAYSFHIDQPSLEATYLGGALATFILTLSPQRILLGGGVMEQQHLFPRVRNETARVLQDYLKLPELHEGLDAFIAPPGLGSRAGICGALALAENAGT